MLACTAGGETMSGYNTSWHRSNGACYGFYVVLVVCVYDLTRPGLCTPMGKCEMILYVLFMYFCLRCPVDGCGAVQTFTSTSVT